MEQNDGTRGAGNSELYNPVGNPLLMSLPAGDRAIMIRSSEPALQGERLQRQMAHAAAWLEASGWEWLEDAVPGYDSVLAVYDPIKLFKSDRNVSIESRSKENKGAPALWQSAKIRIDNRLSLLPPLEKVPERPPIEIPVRYGGDGGPDLLEAARRSGMSPEAFVRAHSSPVYRVVMIGFLPGFPYLDGLPPELAQPRRETPRIRVPAGSVGIGGAQTGIYPSESPGGWQLIGRTDTVLVDISRERPSLLTAGDRIRFVPL
ncbi:inhibitor of KinA [Paenibacillaceae bacterium GAS479]|nr:inhibitor of KinA [Paenibacillaceae bacterium GAS479]